VAQQAFGAFGSAGGHRTMARAEVNLADGKEPAFDIKDHRKMLSWIMARTETRAGVKPAAKPEAGAAKAPNGRANG
jgi:hypothetical protein